MSGITTISFAVPTIHALEFQTRAHEILAQLTREERPEPQLSTAQFTPLSSDDVRGIDVWELPDWLPDDHAQAAWIAASLPTHPQAVLDYLVLHAGTWVTGTQIGEKLGLQHGSKSVPPSFKSMANRCRRVGRRPVWEYDSQKGYRVSHVVADLFRDELEAANNN